MNDELRLSRFQLKRAHKQLGRQADTIHVLRAELAEVRMLNSKIERGELRRLERQYGLLAESFDELADENDVLREKLGAGDETL